MNARTIRIFETGRTLSQNGRYFEALLYLEQALGACTSNLDIAKCHMELANVRRAMDETNLSIEHYIQAIALFTDNARDKAQCHYQLGVLYQRQNKPQLAMLNFEYALASFPENGMKIQIYLAAAKLDKEGQEEDLSVQFLNQALELCQDSDIINQSECYFHRGLAYLKLKKTDLAIADFSKTLSLSPANEMKALCHFNRAGAYTESGQFDSAIADCSGALLFLTSDLDRARCFQVRSSALSGKKNNESAIADLTRAIECPHQDSNFRAQCHGERAALYSKQNQHHFTIVDLNHFLALRPQTALKARMSIILDRANAYQSLGRHELALADYTLVLNQAPENFDRTKCYVNRGVTYRKKGSYELAIHDFTQVIAHSNKHPILAYHERGQVYYTQKNYESAIADFNQALVLIPENKERALKLSLYCSCARANAHLGKVDLSTNNFNQAFELCSDELDKAQVYSNRALVNRVNGDLDAAIRDSAMACDLFPDDHPKKGHSCFYLAKLYWEQGNRDLAICNFMLAIDLNPGIVESLPDSMLAIMFEQYPEFYDNSLKKLLSNTQRLGACYKGEIDVPILGSNGSLMNKPVILACGDTDDLNTIQQQSTCPSCQTPITENYLSHPTPNLFAQKITEEYVICKETTERERLNAVAQQRLNTPEVHPSINEGKDAPSELLTPENSSPSVTLPSTPVRNTSTVLGQSIFDRMNLKRTPAPQPLEAKMPEGYPSAKRPKADGP